MIIFLIYLNYIPNSTALPFVTTLLIGRFNKMCDY